MENMLQLLNIKKNRDYKKNIIDNYVQDIDYIIKDNNIMINNIMFKHLLM
jgi:hypothetical protein